MVDYATKYYDLLTHIDIVKENWSDVLIIKYYISKGEYDVAIEHWISLDEGIRNILKRLPNSGIWTNKERRVLVHKRVLKHLEHRNKI